MITRHQIAAARTFLEWTQEDLSINSGVSLGTIKVIESGQSSNPRQSTLAPILKAFELHGIEFIDGGLRQKNDLATMLEGDNGVRLLYDDMANTAEAEGGVFYIYVVGQEELIADLQGSKYLTTYRERMNKISGVHVRMLRCVSDPAYVEQQFLSVKYLPDTQYYPSLMFFSYGNKLALITKPDTIKITIIHQQEFMELFRKLFEQYWSIALKIHPDGGHK
jgi:predicted transcriptional regulator